MSTFEGVATQFEITKKGFAFRIGGVKFGFHGGNLAGIAEGDYVTGTYHTEEFPDSKTGKMVSWNKIDTVQKGTAPAGAPAQRASSPASAQQHHKQGGDFVFPIPEDNYQRSVVRREVLAIAQANMGELADRVEVLRLAKFFEAYCCGDVDIPEGP